MERRALGGVDVILSEGWPSLASNKAVRIILYTYYVPCVVWRER